MDMAEPAGVEEGQRIVHRALEIANRYSGAGPLLAAFVAEIKSFTGCEAVGIRFVDDMDALPFHASSGYCDAFLELEGCLDTATDSCMCVNVMLGNCDASKPFYTEGGSFHTDNVTEFLGGISAEDRGSVRTACHDQGYESIAVVPIRLGDQILGVVHVADRRTGLMPLHVVETLEKISLQLGVAFQRARAEEDIKNVARFPLENPSPVGRVHRDGKVLFANPIGIKLLAKWDSAIGKPAPEPMAQLAKTALDQGQKEEIEVAYDDRMFSLAIVPVPGMEYVNLYGRDITEEIKMKREISAHQDLLEEVVEERTSDLKSANEDLEMSHQKLRDLASHVQHAREEERINVAREIHDELGQVLTVLKFDLAWIAKRAENIDNETLRTAIAEKVIDATRLADSTIQSVRRISTGLRPSVLDHFGLIAAIEWQADEFEEHTGIACSVTPPAEKVKFDQTTSIALFRILQETITNSARHSGATKIGIVFKKADGHFVLTVRDNGKGIRDDEISDINSIGLVGMRERALTVDGEFNISGLEGKGTTVTVSIPAEAAIKSPAMSEGGLL